MVKVIQDNKLLIDFFHESLSSETLSLYISQDKSKIKKKKKVKGYDWCSHISVQVQYENGLQQNIPASNGEKGQRISERKYLILVKKIVIRIQPPLLEKELVTLIINTFKSSLYEYLLGNRFASFINTFALHDYRYHFHTR
jgi:hypothetical protein